MEDAFGVSLAGAGRRTARDADPLGEGSRLDRLDALIGGSPRRARVECGEGRDDHHARLLDALPAERCKMVVETGRLRERRDANERMETGRGEDRQAERKLVVDAKSTGRNRLDAARPTRLAGRKAQQPAVNPALLSRRARVDAGVFDAGGEGLVEGARQRRAARADTAASVHRTRSASSASARAASSRANSRNASAPFDDGSKTSPGMP